jgi:hypothetical protein
MAESMLTEFHYMLKDMPKFNFGEKGFDIVEIKDYYSIKVSG